MISTEDIKNLARLARLELAPEEEWKMCADLEKILAYFEELKGVKTDDVAPLTGGGALKDVFRSDENGERMPARPAVDAFPEKTSGFLKVPPVFE